MDKNKAQNQNLWINGECVEFTDEANLLSVIRRANIEIPTFCYHSELSVYGACRLCIVDIDGRGILTSCSTKPEPGMQVRTNTRELREIRKISIELLLAGHQQSCPTCVKSDSCKLLDIARRLGVEKVRFKQTKPALPLDQSGDSLTRDPNKCVLCGDCVRYCDEIQGVGAIDFIHRGAKSQVAPAFSKGIGEVECVNCGQCAALCPTGAITPRSETDHVWQALDDRKKTVVAQLAPAVRAAFGEAFGVDAGEMTTGKIVAALKQLGFNQVYDTSFAADLTVIEEANEFLTRLQTGRKLPQFTSCCPAWVKFAEQYHPELLPNLSTCRSPQQMFAALAKKMLPEQFKIAPENLAVVSIMPCTAKKFEAKREEFKGNGGADADHVLTTQEVSRMIKEAGIRFEDLEPRSFDLPMGFKTGAGLIFGSSGGVTEAVLRYTHEKVTGQYLSEFEFHQVRDNNGLLIREIVMGDQTLKVAVVFGLQKTRELIGDITAGKADFHLVEVMACPGGCVSGAGQPVARETAVRRQRSRHLYNADETMQLHKPQENPYVKECYERILQEPGSAIAHQLLHTSYRSRKPVLGNELPDTENGDSPAAKVEICVGTGCFLRGSQNLLSDLNEHLQSANLKGKIEVTGTFCHERCKHGPIVAVNDRLLENCDLDKARQAVKAVLDERNSC